MRTWIRPTGLLVLPLLAFGCSSTRIARPDAGSEIKTVATVGDRPLPTVTGQPGDQVTGESIAPLLRPSSDGRISGRVVDDLGEPVPDATVRLAEGGISRGRVVRTQTDRAGGFTLRGLRPETEYTVIAEYEDDQGILTGRVLARSSDTDVHISLLEAESESIARNTGRINPGVNRVSGRLEAPRAPLDPAAEADEGPAPEADDLVAPAASPRRSSPRMEGPANFSPWRRTGSASRSPAPAATEEPEPRPEPEPEPETSPRVPFEPASDGEDDVPNPLPPAIEGGPVEDAPPMPADGEPATPLEPEAEPISRADPAAEELSVGAGELVAAAPMPVVPAREAAPAAAAPPIEVAPAEPGPASDFAAAAGAASPYDPFEEVARSAPPIEPIARAGRRPAPQARPEPDNGPSSSPARKRPSWGELPSAEMARTPVSPIQKASLAASIPNEPREPIDPPPARAVPDRAGEPTSSRNEPSTGTSTAKAESFCDYDPRHRRIADFQLPDLEGRAFRFKDLDADYVLLDFWGTWCAPCRESVPHLVELQKRMGEKRLLVVGIACEQGSPEGREVRITRFARQNGVNYPIVLGGQDGDDPVQKALHVQVYPTMILLDREGQILWQDTGATPITMARLERVLAALSREGQRKRSGSIARVNQPLLAPTAPARR